METTITPYLITCTMVCSFLAASASVVMELAAPVAAVSRISRRYSASGYLLLSVRKSWD